ncbi:hypothetical protein [Phenylobacterium sp.]|jgi:hypothetical protein|uniref:hypothetical protein n=1 Tax=Phenylobacterium sp. TaxID=1871053 RepID=UPI0025F6EAAC|nr:hypothetical protein [Phenylobacterium sp.]MCA3711102.1 hypothetical protein [Phenylobacterium sp.]MCA3723621.1 hypothetical protein [Phenylobacterium sp.]MCA3725496.1 hypothetical protein [Phenylobacterium sp.]MCA6259765.1 hypothetical protein [Phenylobacterium sp.]
MKKEIYISRIKELQQNFLEVLECFIAPGASDSDKETVADLFNEISDLFGKTAEAP